MKNNRQEETIRAYFAREQVPEQVHQKLTETFRLLEERPVKKRRPVWKGVAVSFSTVAAAFVLLVRGERREPRLRREPAPVGGSLPAV